MTFTLKVQFSGLCMYLVNPDDRQIAVVLPDGRKPLDGRPLRAADKQSLAFHTGYIRYDLADAGVEIPFTGREGTPAFEVVHRFDFEEIDFGLGFDEPLAGVDLQVAEIEKFAPDVTPIDGLFSANPPKQLLMRTVLRGGTIKSQTGDGIWQFSDLLQKKKGTFYTKAFAGCATWIRPVYHESLAIQLKGFDGSVKTTIRLKPQQPGGTVRLRIANLCADNPLEWPEMPLRTFNGDADVDFKWFYALLKPPTGDFTQFIKTKDDRLPCPTVLGGKGCGRDDCTCGMIGYDHTSAVATTALPTT